MREIKFRAWDIDGNCWIPKVAISVTAEGVIQTWDELDEAWYPETIDIAINEYTGLCDENGIEIFEGDILQIHGIKATVVWNSETASFAFKNDIAVSSHMFGAHFCKIMGNVYENPELLAIEGGGEE